MEKKEQKKKEAVSWEKAIKERREIKKESKKVNKKIEKRKKEIVGEIEERSDERKEEIGMFSEQVNLATQSGDIEKVKELLNRML